MHRRAHRGDVAQQEVEVVAAPVVKDHWDGLGRLGRDVAGVAQRPEILPGAVAVVELLLGGLEGREALPPGHADGPSLASPGEVVVGQLEKVVQHGADGVVLVAVPLVVREPQPQLLGWHVAAAPDSDVAGRSRDGLARRLLLRYVDRRGGRAVDLEARVARQGRELCGGLVCVASWARAAALSECARPSLDSTGWRGGAARRPSWRSGPCTLGTCTPRSRRCWWAWLPGSAPACRPAPGSCGSGCSGRCAGEAARCAGRRQCRSGRAAGGRGSTPARPSTGSAEDEDLHPPGVAELMSLKFTGRSVGRPEKSTPAWLPAQAVLGGRPARGRRRSQSSLRPLTVLRVPDGLLLGQGLGQLLPAASRLVGGGGAGMLASCCEGAGKRERLSATSNFVLMAAIMVPARADGDQSSA